jgi:hypothetical protein
MNSLLLLVAFAFVVVSILTPIFIFLIARNVELIRRILESRK